MTVAARVEVLINRPRTDVAALMFDPTKDAVWTSGVVASRPLTEGPLRPGSRVEREVTFLGRRFAYVYAVEARDDDRSVDLTVDKPFPMRIRYQLEDAGASRTRASIAASGEPGGFFRLAGPLLGTMVRRNLGRDLNLLKSELETAHADRR